jgi:hypothetical protein
VIGSGLIRCSDSNNSFWTSDSLSSGELYFSGGGEYYTSTGSITDSTGLTEIFGSSVGFGSCP